MYVKGSDSEEQIYSKHDALRQTSLAVCINICWDIREGLLVEDAAAGGIFTEHDLEHIPFRSFVFVAAEFIRALKPHGWVRVVVLDAAIYLEQYVNKGPMPNALDDAIEDIYSPLMSINHIMRSHGHEFIYGFETMAAVLTKVGFTRIAKKLFGESTDPKLLVDTPQREMESPYVEAQRPGR